MTTNTAGRTALLRAAALLPLLALTACAGSQRFTGGGPAQSAYGQPSYSQPSLPPAPPISSAPVTSEPLPPPGGYPVASAPQPEALPPEDPYYGGGAPSPSAPPQSEPVPTLRGGDGQVATLGGQSSGGTGGGSSRGAVSSRDGVIGNWTAREATGGSCRVQLSSSPALDLYRANAWGCSNRDLQKVTAWDYRNGEVYLYQQGGTVVARLRASDGGSMNGAVTKSGAALSMSR